MFPRSVKTVVLITVCMAGVVMTADPTTLMSDSTENQVTVLALLIAVCAPQGPSFFTVSRVREIGCFWGNPVKSTVDP